MAEGPRAPVLRPVAGAPLTETIPPASKSQPTSRRDEADPHESVTIAPPAPHFLDLMRQPTPVPSPNQPVDQHFRAALDAGARAGTSLSELTRMMTELAGGLRGAKNANEQLVQELTTLRALLDAAHERQDADAQRIAALELALEASQREAKQAHHALAAQQDEFLAALIEEHEEEVRALSTRHPGMAQDPATAELVQRLLRERDELRAEASQLRAGLGVMRSQSTTPPPPVATSRPPSFQPPALRLDAEELDSNLRTRPSAPRFASVMPRLTPIPPAEAPTSGWTPVPPPPAVSAVESSAAPPPRVTSAATLPSPLPGPSPVLRPRLDPAARPLTDYSLGGDVLPSEKLEGVRLSSQPPRK